MTAEEKQQCCDLCKDQHFYEINKCEVCECFGCYDVVKGGLTYR